MYSLLFLGVVAFICSVVLTPIVRRIFLRLDIVDRPDNIRKLHKLPIVRVGGIAVAAAYVIPFVLLLFIQFRAGVIIWSAFPLIVSLLPAATIMFITGLVDDLANLKVWQKLAGQFAAATAAYIAGIQITGLDGKHFAYWWSYPLTIVWLLATTNSLNLLDGVDGLAAGVGFFATVTITLAAALGHNFGLAFATVPLAACLLGFLWYNFNPARVFLGDCGSLLIGFLLGCYGVLWSQKSATLLGMTAPLLALSIPLIDTALAIVRRFLKKQPIFSADRGHIHHRLLDRGLSPRRVVLLLYAICLFASLFSLSMLRHAYEVPTLVAFCIATCFGVHRLRVIEINTAVEMIREGAFRTLLNLQISLKRLEASLSTVTTPDECWAILKNSYRDFGFVEIRAQLAGKVYADKARSSGEGLVCRVAIPLCFDDYVHLHFQFSGALGSDPAVPFADAIGKALGSKFNAPKKQTASETDLELTGSTSKQWHSASAAG